MTTNITSNENWVADLFINRVPHIILLYWVIKIASTTLGETGADMFSMTYNLGYGTTILIFMGLAIIINFYSVIQYKRLLKTLQAVEIPVGYNINAGIWVNIVLGIMGVLVCVYLARGFL